jgi:hypothetical protein
MARVLKSGLMAPDMMEIGSRAHITVMEGSFIRLRRATLENGKTTRLLDTELTLIKMEQFPKGNGKTTWETAKAKRQLQKAEFTKVTSLMTKNMVRVDLPGLQKVTMMERSNRIT